MIILCKNHKKELKIIFLIFILIYVNITDRRTDKHIKSIVRNLTKKIFFSVIDIN